MDRGNGVQESLIRNGVQPRQGSGHPEETEKHKIGAKVRRTTFLPNRADAVETEEEYEGGAKGRRERYQEIPGIMQQVFIVVLAREARGEHKHHAKQPGSWMSTQGNNREAAADKVSCNGENADRASAWVIRGETFRRV